MSKICGNCAKYVPPVDGYCSTDPTKCPINYGDRACKDYIYRYDNPEQNAETSGWYWDQYKYTYCCKYCGEPANELVPVGGDVWAKPSFSYCPHCGRFMKGGKVNGSN